MFPFGLDSLWFLNNDLISKKISQSLKEIDEILAWKNVITRNSRIELQKQRHKILTIVNLRDAQFNVLYKNQSRWKKEKDFKRWKVIQHETIL